jgi:hypothetical protein
MVVAVGSMGKVQMTGHQVINMVSVGHSLMPAGGVMTMVRVVTLAAMGRCTGDGIVWCHV